MVFINKWNRRGISVSDEGGEIKIFMKTTRKIERKKMK